MTPINVPNNALVLVGDGKKALFLRNKGTPQEIELVVEKKLEQENPRTGEQGTDRPGRKPGGDGVSRSAADETDWHQQAEQRFAAEIAATLYQMGHANEFQDLVMVAPPRMLGDLRAALHPEVSHRVRGELARDLTAHPVPQLTQALAGLHET